MSQIIFIKTGTNEQIDVISYSLEHKIGKQPELSIMTNHRVNHDVNDSFELMCLEKRLFYGTIRSCSAKQSLVNAVQYTYKLEVCAYTDYDQQDFNEIKQDLHKDDVLKIDTKICMPNGAIKDIKDIVIGNAVELTGYKILEISSQDNNIRSCIIDLCISHHCSVWSVQNFDLDWSVPYVKDHKLDMKKKWVKDNLVISNRVEKQENSLHFLDENNAISVSRLKGNICLIHKQKILFDEHWLINIGDINHNRTKHIKITAKFDQLFKDWKPDKEYHLGDLVSYQKEFDDIASEEEKDKKFSIYVIKKCIKDHKSSKVLDDNIDSWEEMSDIFTDSTSFMDTEIGQKVWTQTSSLLQWYITQKYSPEIIEVKIDFEYGYRLQVWDVIEVDSKVYLITSLNIHHDHKGGYVTVVGHRVFHSSSEGGDKLMSGLSTTCTSVNSMDVNKTELYFPSNNVEMKNCIVDSKMQDCFCIARIDERDGHIERYINLEVSIT